MARRDADADDEGMGSGENLEPEPEDGERRASFERAARAGADELAGVVEAHITGLANEFEDRVVNQLKVFGEEMGAAIQPTEKQRSQFVVGAIFGAIVLAAGVVLGRKGGS